MVKLTRNQKFGIGAVLLLLVLVGSGIFSTVGNIGNLTKCVNGQCGIPQGETLQFGALEMASASKMLTSNAGYLKYPMTYTLQLYDPSNTLVKSQSFNYVVARYDNGNTLTYYGTDGKTPASTPAMTYTLPATAKTGTWMVKDKTYITPIPLAYGTAPTSFPSASGGTLTLDVTDTSTYFSFNVIAKQDAAALGFECTIDDHAACLNGNIRSCDLSNGKWKTTMCSSSAPCKLVNLVPVCSVGCTENAIKCIDSTHIQRCTKDASSALYWSGAITLISQERINANYVNKQVCSNDALTWQQTYSVDVDTLKANIDKYGLTTTETCGTLPLSDDAKKVLYEYIKEQQFAYSDYQIPQTDAMVTDYLGKAGLTTNEKICSTMSMILEVKTINNCPACVVKSDATATFETCSDGSRRPKGTCPTPCVGAACGENGTGVKCCDGTTRTTCPIGLCDNPGGNNTTSTCGNSRCDANEDWLSCPADCLLPEKQCMMNSTVIKLGACDASKTYRCALNATDESTTVFTSDSTCTTNPDKVPKNTGGASYDIKLVVAGIAIVALAGYYFLVMRKKKGTKR